MTSLRPSVLIVDDEDRNRRLLEALLRAEKYETRTAADGPEALRSVAAEPPDLILLDVMMPGMDGNEVASILKADAATQNIPIIIITAQTDREARLAALDAGAEDFLTKPIDRAELYLRVRNLLRLKELNDFLADHRAQLENEVQARTFELQRFRTAMDSTGDAIFLVDRNSMRFIEVNATAVDMLGYTREELLELGPSDLQPELSKPLDCLSAVAGHGTTRSSGKVRRKDGSYLSVEALRHVQRSGEDWIVVAVLRDITSRNEADERLDQLAHFDALTGLPNRTRFYETLKQALLHVPARSSVAVLFIDLDHFKNVNDTLGHGVGDELLIQVGQRVVGCLWAEDTVSRLGGDEFAILLTTDLGPHRAASIAAKIQEVLREPFDLKGHEVSVTASIGITTYPEDASDSETLIKYADTAMYQAKQAGRDAFRFFTAQMNTEALGRLELEVALRKAVKNNEFLLHYQPQVRLDDGRVVGLEALLRWERPGHGFVAPSTFIPALEESGLIVSVGAWVIDAVCEQISVWRRSAIGPTRISVNVAARQLIEGDLEKVVLSAIDDHEVPSHLLELELTESTLMADTDRTTALLESLRARGVGISVDDFGTGYSSLAYLRRFPIDKLKIDISFIREITTNADDAAISLAIIHMAHSLSLDVIAEGVETSAQFSYLRRHGCDQMQGYYLSRPLPVEAVEEMLRRGSCLSVPQDDKAPLPATLLLVDDDPQVLNALRMLFADDGYQILTAATASEGFQALALHPVHVLICDERMPGTSGTDFLAQVKDMHPETLRIVLSGCADDAVLLGSINRGEVYRYYTKPWDAAELRNNIADAFRHYRNLQQRSIGSGFAKSTDDNRLGRADHRGTGQAPDEASQRDQTVTAALRGLLRIRSATAAADLLQLTVQQLGATVMPAADAGPDALPIDLSLGEGPPLLAVIELLGPARMELERVLPRLVEDARQAVDLLRQTERLAEASNHDKLTGLANRRVLERVLARADDGMVVMIDLDHFKRINDTLGHATGDAVLSHFGRLLMAEVRAVDTACRLGGEEFVVVAAGLDEGRARDLVSRIRAAWAETAPHPVTFSAGLAPITASGGTSALLAADRALYRAKRTGRDRTEVDGHDSRAEAIL